MSAVGGDLNKSAMSVLSSHRSLRPLLQALLLLYDAGHGARVPDHTYPQPAAGKRDAGRGRRLREAVACQVHSILRLVFMLVLKSQPHLLCDAARHLLMSLRESRGGCRLAAFICGHEVFQISVSSTYGLADFRENLLRLYTKVTARLLCGSSFADGSHRAKGFHCKYEGQASTEHLNGHQIYVKPVLACRPGARASRWCCS